MLTQVAPAAVFTSALRSGQSATASEPSSIASVSRFGEATDPESRWSRPMTIGRADLARPDQLVEREAGLRPLAVAEPADPGRQALERDARLGHLDPAAQARVVREQLEDRAVRAEDVRRVAAERRPAERPAALAELRPDERRHEARVVEGVLDARPPAPAPAGCCRSRRRPRRRRGTRASPGRGRPSSASSGGCTRRAGCAGGSARRPARSRPGRSRRAGRARRSGP